MINFYEPFTAYLNEQRDSQYAYDILIFVSQWNDFIKRFSCNT